MARKRRKAKKYYKKSLALMDIAQTYTDAKVYYTGGKEKMKAAEKKSDKYYKKGWPTFRKMDILKVK
jgi:TPR repeat protein